MQASLLLVGGFLFIWGWFVPWPYEWAVASLVLAVVGSAIAAFCGWVPLAWKEGEQPRGNGLFLMSALGLGLRGFDFALLDAGQPLFLAVAAAAGFCCIAAWKWPELRAKGLAVVLGCAAAAGLWGAAVLANCAFDVERPKVAYTHVLEKWETGRKYTSHMIRLAGDTYPGVHEELRVHRQLYDVLKPGDEVCVYVSPGALGWRWYDIWTCP